MTKTHRPLPLAVAAENADRGPFDRKRLPLRTVRAALAELDAQRDAVAAALTALSDAYTESLKRGAGYIADPVSDAWNGLHDASDALDRLRAKIEDNPRPIPESERGTYELVMQNID